MHRGDYRPMPSVATVDGGLLLHSPTLGLDVRLKAGEELRFHDPATSQNLLSYEETQTQMREARTQMREERAAHQATMARLEELEARLGRSG